MSDAADKVVIAVEAWRRADEWRQYYNKYDVGEMPKGDYKSMTDAVITARQRTKEAVEAVMDAVEAVMDEIVERVNADVR